MATLAERIIDLTNAIGADIKDLRVKQGDLATLSTTQKSSLVAAINEIASALGSSSVINDAAGDGNTTNTWSANKIFDTIEAAKLAVKNDLTNGAAAALDTLSEIATALNNDPNFATTIATGLSNRVRFDAAQTLTAPQKVQACDNLGIGDPDTNYVTAYTTAKA
jgi:hypothetical protein